MGLINVWIEKTFARITPGNKDIYLPGEADKLYENPNDDNSANLKRKHKKLSLSDLKSVFYICFIGHILAAVVFGFEFLNVCFKK